MNADYPSGTVTFLFTDIQGSTPLWEQDAQGMREAVRLHTAALHEAVERHGGQVFKIVGDETEAVFVQPQQALDAAVAAQKALLRLPWRRPGPLKVRMGLHTGPAKWEGDDYAQAHTFNRVARIMSCGHGGQILLSEETANLVRPQLPAEISLRDMGKRRLKGLMKQEHLFQVVAAGLADNFPPLKTLGKKQASLPAEVTPFIGREREIQEVCDLLSPQQENGRHVRLLTLIGPGGTGKTRLALQAGKRLLDQFADGVFFVDLSAYKDSSLVLPAIERTLSGSENGNLISLEGLGDYLREKELLLVLDNFEQVLPAAADVVALLKAAGDLKLLVTSRILLHMYGETGYEVGPLTVPSSEHLPPPEQLAEVEAVQLFSVHARAVKPDFAIDQTNGAAVAEICRRLDGLPLAIELASARIRLLSPKQMVRQLDNRFQLLSGGARNLPPRQQTLYQAIDWSYDLLSDQEQALFKRLGVFAGSCTFDGAEKVCNFAGDIDVFSGLAGLIDHSLVKQGEAEGEPRFVMLQTIHEYALQKLRRNGRFQQVREQHLVYYLHLAEEAYPFLESAEQDVWLDRLEREYANLSSALRFAIEQQQSAEGLRMAQALRIFWFSRGYLLQGRKFVGDLLALPMAPEYRMRLLDIAGFLARYIGDYPAAEAYIRDGLETARHIGDQHALANALANLGFVNLQQSQLTQAREVYEEALLIYQELADAQGTADAQIHLGQIAFYEDDLAGAVSSYNASLAIWQRLGDKQGIAYAQDKLGDAAFRAEDWKTADSNYRASLLGAAAIGFQLCLATGFEGLALIAARRGQPERAMQLAGAAAEIRKKGHIPASAARRQFIESGLTPAYKVLNPGDVQAAQEAGRLWDLDEAISYALATPPVS